MPSTWIETTGGSFPAFTFTRRIDAPEVNYLVEVSEDLTTWSECLRNDGGTAVNSYTQLSASEDHGDGSQTVRIRYNLDLSAISGKMFFFRIRVSE